MVSSRRSVGEWRSGDAEADSDDSECSERDVSGVRADSDASSLPGGVRHVRQNSSRPELRREFKLRIKRLSTSCTIASDPFSKLFF